MLTSPARRAAVLGSPISHSLSPVLHLAAYRALGLRDWTYDVHEVQVAELPGFVSRLDPTWAGLSLTMPLKEAALELAAEVSDLAQDVGAVNTLTRRPDGGWRGENTDVYGVSQALGEAGRSQVDTAVVLGSGATARSVVAALAGLGCAKVTFAVRSQARTQTLEQARRAGLEVAVARLGRLADLLGQTPVVISTLPPDADPASALKGSLAPGRQLPDLVLLDVVYTGWPTPLARILAETGAKVVSGLEILVHQGAEQVQLMTGLRPPVDQLRAAGLAELAGRAGRAGRAGPAQVEQR